MGGLDDRVVSLYFNYIQLCLLSDWIEVFVLFGGRIKTRLWSCSGFLIKTIWII